MGIVNSDGDSDPVPEIPESSQSLARLVASEDVVTGMNRLTSLTVALQAAVTEARFWRIEEINGKPGALDDFKRSNEQVKAVAQSVAEAAAKVHRGMRCELVGETNE